MAQPLGLRAPADMHTSACTSFMPSLRTNQTSHACAKGLLHSFKLSSCMHDLPQQAQASGCSVPSQSEASHHPVYIQLLSLPYFHFQAQLKWKLIAKHTYTMKNPGQSFQVIWHGSSVGAQLLTRDLSLFFGHKWACSLQGLAERANRRGVTPVFFHFQGPGSSLVLSNGLLRAILQV